MQTPALYSMSGLADITAATLEVATMARRSLILFTPDLEPALYNTADFMDAVRHLILPRQVARLRILVNDPSKAVQEQHRIIDLARQLSSFIEIRRTHADHTHHTESYIVADERALVYRETAEWVGRFEPKNPGRGRELSERFMRIWEKSSPEIEFRRLHV